MTRTILNRTPWALAAIELKGDRVAIRTSRPADHRAIASAINDPIGWDARRWGRDSAEKIVRMLAERESRKANGQINPLVYFAGGEIAGVSNFLRPDEMNRSLEIGGTWVAPRWKKTFVNTEVKFLLLKHCFETLGAERVEFRVDVRNAESQRAMIRIGATLEGRLRRRQIGPDGEVRDGFLFSIVRTDWGEVEARLLARLGGAPRVESLPREILTARLRLRPYEIADAPAVFALVDRNRADFVESHPKTVKALGAPQLAEDYVIDKLREWHLGASFCYGAFLRSDGSPVGQLSVKNVDWEKLSAELGYFVDARNRGAGLAREMAQAVLARLDLLRFRRVFVRVLPGNEPSLRLARSVGFEDEGIHRREFMLPGGVLSDIVYLSRTGGDGA
ncbi:MAG: GNAT family N-acetyltransferase [Elusimicrobia bacterium]|nr:GNAT family N-acetyltransferase [Elusimicrobiota bacterium]